MNTNKIQYYVADAMKHLAKITSATTFEQPDEEKFKELVNEHLAIVAENIAKCGEEVNWSSAKTVTKNTEKKIEKFDKPVSDFTDVAFRKICGMLTMAYPSFCAQTFIDTYKKDGTKAAILYVLNDVAKANATMNYFRAGENDSSVEFEFKVDKSSNFYKNSEMTVRIVNTMLSAFGYQTINGTFKNDAFTFNASTSKGSVTKKSEATNDGLIVVRLFDSLFDELFSTIY